MKGETSLSIIQRKRRVEYDSWANLNALTGLEVGDLGYATDLEELYRYSGAVWQKVAGWAVVFSGAKVYDGVMTGSAWVDLDLSATVGAAQAVVLLKCKNTNAGVQFKPGFRKNGDTDALSLQGVSSQDHGGQFGIGVNEFSYFICVTDATGIIEQYQNGVDCDCEIYVEAYAK